MAGGRAHCSGTWSSEDAGFHFGDATINASGGLLSDSRALPQFDDARDVLAHRLSWGGGGIAAVMENALIRQFLCSYQSRLQLGCSPVTGGCVASRPFAWTPHG